MALIEVFDPALCDHSEISGAEIDPVLVAFETDMQWAQGAGANIRRFNLTQQPREFAENAAVKAFLAHSGEAGLPLTLVDGSVVLAGRYPNRLELARWAPLPLPIFPAKPFSSGACGCGGGVCG